MTDTIRGLQQQLKEVQDKLGLIRERKAQYVLEVDIPLQLVREERTLESQIGDLRKRLERLRETPCPYRGLLAFREKDAPYFFGRKVFTERLVKAVDGRTSLVAVVGPSGTGKSSVVSAGLLPVLAWSGQWLFAPFRPHDDPMLNLARALVPLYETDKTRQLGAARELSADLHEGKLPLSDVCDLVHDTQPEHRLLIIADQFEEVYSPRQDDATRRQFLDTLLAAFIGEQPSSPRLVLTLRADFLGQASLYRPFADALQDATELLGPMTRDELREAIERPAQIVGCEFQSGLVERMLDDIHNQPGNLPLLEFALTQLWDNQTADGLLTHAAYDSIGQVEGAIARRAEEQFADLEAVGQGETVRRIFTRLVLPGEDTLDTRRRASRSELETSEALTSPGVWTAVQALADTRLVVTDRDPATGVETVEVAHEALIQSWQRLKGWVDSKREFYIWRQSRLEPKLDEWTRNEGSLLRNEDLVEAKRWLQEQPQELSSAERDYIYHSIIADRTADLEYWLPKYGTVAQTLAFLQPYLHSKDPDQRSRGLRALRWLPHSEVDPDVYGDLERFVLDDESLDVANLAAHAICQRGDIARLTALLESPDLPRSSRDRLVAALASARNLPELGTQVERALTANRRRVLLRAARELVLEYRSEIAIALSFTYVLGMLIWLLPSVVLNVVSRMSEVGYSVISASLGSFEVIILLGFGLYAFIQRRLIDKQPLQIRDLYLGVIVVFLYNLIYSFLDVSGVLIDIRKAFAEAEGLDVVASQMWGFSAINVATSMRSLAVTLAGGFALLVLLFRSELPDTTRGTIERSLWISGQTMGLVMLVSALALVVVMGVSRIFLGESLGSYLPGSPVAEDATLSTITYTSASGVFSFLAGTGSLFARLLGFYLGLRFAFGDRLELLYKAWNSRV